ncbi:ABC transporter substrate-binding protein [Rhodococcoides fascians A25f]|uniref:ABC transporter substrate-binding protein n=1 Tax=Rhodococcoides fascians TaxID=1828 RepID=UPI0005616374|nr:ABC transporter substrate-binding protein [Rhodococcus fascians]QII07338.1 ABC transporter substrate-binding protein [Rhodococcus fascians A25f]
MILGKRLTVVAAAALLLLSAACGGGGNSQTSGSTVGGPAGEPVLGGTARIIENAEPRSLDPAVIANSYANSPVLGNALYGTLMINDPETNEIEYKMAEDFSTSDGGKTFILELRDGIAFSDGTPYDAAAVKTAWEHVKAPSTASPDRPQAGLIESAEVVAPTTLKVTLTEPVPNFANAVLQTSLNWIASPATLAADQATIDSKPIGAGPFTLVRWSRQDVIELTRNDNYYDAPRPYLDKLEIRAIVDPDQRYNTLVSGGADLALEGVWTNIDKASKGGLQNSVVPLGGGIAMVLNNTKAPFDDVRARTALSHALDLEGLDNALYQGTGEIPRTLFDESSPFYKDIPLAEQDLAEAQSLLDELAAEGKPLEFSLSVFPGNSDFGEAVQTQLSTLENITVNVQVIDLAEYGRIMGQKDYDVITSTVMFADPEPRLWLGFNSKSNGNYSGVDDPALDDALNRGRVATDESERVVAYEEVQNRLAELNPVIFYTRASPGVMAGTQVGGVEQYGIGSVLPETLWIAE